MKTLSHRQRGTRSNRQHAYLRTIRSHWDTLRRRYKLKEIGIFGSVVHGTETKKSDIDILVEYEELPDLLLFINLENYLEEILKRKVDLVEKHGVRPELKDRILNEVVYL